MIQIKGDLRMLQNILIECASCPGRGGVNPGTTLIKQVRISVKDATEISNDAFKAIDLTRILKEEK